MANKQVVSINGDTVVPLTAEEEQDLAALQQKGLVKRQEAEAEAARLQEIKASQYVADWDTRIQGKTFLEIKTLYDGATQQQKSDLLFYLLLVRALEVKG